MPALSSYHQYRRTDNATLIASDLRTGKTAYGPNGLITGAGYFPAMMQFDGTDGYYSRDSNVTSSGSSVAGIARFRAPAKAGTSVSRVFWYRGPNNHNRVLMQIGDASIATTDLQGRIEVIVQNSSGTNICRLCSTAVVTDDIPHTLFFSFNGTTGAAQFILNGVADENASYSLRVAPTTGTLDSGASSDFYVGAGPAITYLDGEIGFCGVRDAYLTNWSDFMQADGTPKNIESTLNTVWGAQPLFWNESGYMQDNKGSAGAMTANGTIVLAAASDWS